MLVLVPQHVLGTIRLERSNHLPRETGGFLIGLRRGDHIEVTDLTRQADGDIATSFSFERASASHRHAILAAWRRSGELESLVGDWHSHPDGARHASATDHRSWSKLVKVTGQPVVGLIDCGAVLPFAFSSAGRWLNKVTELEKIEDAGDFVVFRARQRGKE